MIKKYICVCLWSESVERPQHSSYLNVHFKSTNSGKYMTPPKGEASSLGPRHTHTGISALSGISIRSAEVKPTQSSGPVTWYSTFCTDVKYDRTWESKTVVLTSGMFYSSTMSGCGAENQALTLGCGPKTTFSVPDTQHNSSQNTEEFRTGAVSLKVLKKPELQKQIFVQFIH